MNIPTPMNFKLGILLITPGASAALEDSKQTAWVFLLRHMAGDWGDVDEQDRQLNDEALVEGSRLLSAYHTSQNVKLWIITEGDRSATTILLPEEY